MRSTRNTLSGGAEIDPGAPGPAARHLAMRSRFRDARDYNGGLAGPVRAAHVVWVVLSALPRAVLAWARDPVRRVWAMPLVVIGAAFVLLLPLDGPIIRIARGLQIGGDLRRELEALGQWGQGSSLIIVGAAIYLLDPARRRRLADWLAAVAVAGVGVWIAKVLIGRPRPKFDEPGLFLGPLGQYPVRAYDPQTGERGVHAAWEVWAGISSDLWSMPSSHTAYAVVMAVFLSAMYPALRGVVWTLAVLVGVSRVAFTAHYATDVVVGAAIGAAVAREAIARGWGVRVLDRVNGGRRGGGAAAARGEPHPPSPESQPAGGTESGEDGP